ncbi:MAG: hypothetical protein ACREQ5_00260 [Candidatus Dormibacteria bacterium]
MQVASIFTSMLDPRDGDRDRDDRTNWRSRDRDGQWRYWHRTYNHRGHRWGGYWGR